METLGSLSEDISTLKIDIATINSRLVEVTRLLEVQSKTKPRSVSAPVPAPTTKKLTNFCPGCTEKNPDLRTLDPKCPGCKKFLDESKKEKVVPTRKRRAGRPEEIEWIDTKAKKTAPAKKKKIVIPSSPDIIEDNDESPAHPEEKSAEKNNESLILYLKAADNYINEALKKDDKEVHTRGLDLNK